MSWTPEHEAVRQPMGEAIAVGGESPPSAQIMFSAIDEEKEGDCVPTLRMPIIKEVCTL